MYRFLGCVSDVCARFKGSCARVSRAWCVGKVVRTMLRDDTANRFGLFGEAWLSIARAGPGWGQ